MGFFSDLFGGKKSQIEDQDLGVMTSNYVKGDKVGWQITKAFLGTEVEVFVEGNRQQLNKKQKIVLLEAFKNEIKLESIAEKALRDQYLNANQELKSWRDHFECISISVNDVGFELTFQEKKSLYHFNVVLSDNEIVSVTIDT